jgi:glycosyltransferase involved in cell wall biosynthesis
MVLSACNPFIAVGKSEQIYPVLVVSNIPWDFVWQRHQTLASLWAREGEVLFCELPGIRRLRWSDAGRLGRRLQSLCRGNAGKKSMGQLPPGLRLLRPLVLPATNGLFCAFNRWQLRRLVAKNPLLKVGVDLVFTYAASRTALDLLEIVPHRRLVYDCTDDFLEVAGIPSSFGTCERELMKRAEITLVPSQILFARKSPLARRCVRLPHGAWVERFKCADLKRPGEGDFAVLYYGHLHRQHLDFGLIEKIAEARPSWKIILVGPVKTPHRFPKNVDLPGQQAHERLSTFIECADVLILPYGINNYTAAVMPAKTYECLATGKPVVAAKLPGLVAEFGEVFRFAGGVTDWVEQIERAAREDTDGDRARRRELAGRNSWEVRFGELKQLVAEEGKV